MQFVLHHLCFQLHIGKVKCKDKQVRHPGIWLFSTFVFYVIRCFFFIPIMLPHFVLIASSCIFVNSQNSLHLDSRYAVALLSW